MAVEDTLTEEQKDRLYFMTLVQTYQQIAWVALGKIANPATQKIERQLDQARWAIDMLAMLERRTKGNLAPDEARELAQILYTLRMNYVDEVNKQEQPEKEPQKGAEETSPATEDAPQEKTSSS